MNISTHHHHRQYFFYFRRYFIKCRGTSNYYCLRNLMQFLHNILDMHFIFILNIMGHVIKLFIIDNIPNIQNLKN